jgi:cyclomaltodextrinase / maltogenic alpha-amylase / neopullulanase
MKKLFFFILLFFAGYYQAEGQSNYLSGLAEGAIYEVSPLYYPAGQTQFSSLTSKIPELADLGVKTIYLLPVFKASGIGISASDTVRFKNAYNVQDYYQIDPHYGTGTDLKNLIAAAHANGMRVLFDLVLNHTYYPSVAMDSGWDYRVTAARLADTAAALGYPVKYDIIGGQVFPFVNKTYVGTDSTYSFRGWKDPGGTIHVMHYPTWRWWFGLDYTNPGLIRYIVNLSKYFIRQYDFDGWRLDAPSNNRNPYLFSGTHSMDALLQTVKDSMIALKPSCVMISENPASARTPNPADDFDQMVEASYDDIYIGNTWATLGLINAPSYMVPDLLARLNTENILNNRSRLRFSENHDNPRIQLRGPDLNKPLLVFNATIYPGIPMIQAGQEIGATTLINSIPAGAYSSAQRAMRNFYRTVLRTRNAYNSLKYGTLQDVLAATTAANTSKTYTYIRNYKGEKTLVMINFTGDTIINTMNLPYSAGTILADSLSTSRFTISSPTGFKIKLLPYSARILVTDTMTSTGRIINPDMPVDIYPNPSKDHITIDLHQTDQIKTGSISIYNMEGQPLLQKTLNQSRTDIAIAGLRNGVYLIKVNYSGAYCVRKFVKD